MRRRHGSDAGRGPRRRKWQELRQQPRRGIFLLPSLLTTGNLFCGFLALVLASQSRFTEAAVSIFVGMVMDMLDGKVARLTKTTSQFGVEFDSLADVISFGVAPSILAFAWGLYPLGRLGWAAAFIFAAAAAVRLARFNIQTGATHDKRYFVGMPSPAAAGVPAATVFAYPAGVNTYTEALPVLAMVIVPALLMVSTIRYRSFKTFDLQARRSYPILVLFAAGLALLVSHPEWILVALAYTYLSSAFIGLAWHKLRRREPEPPPQAEQPEMPQLPDLRS